MDEWLLSELCGCCEPPAPSTPAWITNRPGLTAIAYRVGTFASFRQTMLQAIAQEPALQGLTTRQSDDAAITLLELWAAVADVLTFYQEQIANEAFLRTAQERDSVLRLARLLDYHLRPGLATTTHFAFTLEDAATLHIPVGFPVMSVPEQDEQTLFFETVEAIKADARLNRLPILPKPQKVNPFALGRRAAFLTSDNVGWQAAQRLRVGDAVVLFNLNPAEPPDDITGNGGMTSLATYGETLSWNAPDRVVAPTQPWTSPGNTQMYWEISWQNATPAPNFAADLAGNGKSVEEKEIKAIQIEGDRYLLAWTQPIVKSHWPATTQSQVFRRKLRVFGYNAPLVYMTVTLVAAPIDDLIRLGLEPELESETPRQPKWESVGTDCRFSSSQELPLDALYRDLVVGEQLLVQEAGQVPKVLTIQALNEREVALPAALPANSLADHRFRDTVTVATVSECVSFTDRRRVQIYWLQGSPIPLWTGDFPSTITANRLYIPAVKLDAEGTAVEIGRTIVAGELKSGVAIRLNEINKGRSVLLSDHTQQPLLATIAALPTIEQVEGQDFLVLEVKSSATIQLETRSAVLLGNVVLATHGQTIRDEILGNGDATIPFPSFTLQKSPLTYVPSARSVRGESTLRILVNGERWTEVDHLYGQAPTAQIYTVRQADDGTTTIQMGDGITGARLPTGQGNLLATYRQGSGLAGRLKANQLSIPLNRPVGLKSVTNPAPTQGGADPESLAQARTTAPTTVKTFNRAVSLLDFENLITASGEVAKAKATWVWKRLAKAIHLTVAGQEGLPFSSDILDRLHSGLNQQRDPNYLLILSNLIRVPITITATLYIDERYVQDQVKQKAQDALLHYFAFESLNFAQPIHLSDLYRVLQDVTGISHVDIDVLQFKGYQQWTAAELAIRGATAEPLQSHLRIFAARPRTSVTVIDPIVQLNLGSGVLPDVLAAEQAYIQTPTDDIILTAIGGLAA